MATSNGKTKTDYDYQEKNACYSKLPHGGFCSTIEEYTQQMSNVPTTMALAPSDAIPRMNSQQKAE